MNIKRMDTKKLKYAITSLGLGRIGQVQAENLLEV